MSKIYFDNAATTPMAPEVLEEILPYMQSHFGNPSSIHSFGRFTRTAIEQARKTIATCLNVTPGEIFFTSGGTEADNMAIRCSIQDFNIKHAITSKIEHHAVLHTLEDLDNSGKIKLHFVNVDSEGNIDLSHLDVLLKNIAEPALVSLMHANNEIGTLLPLLKVADICNSHNAIFHSDTVQTMAHYSFDLQKIPVNFVVGAAHKFHGPKGVGFIFIRNTNKISPYITGGSQERNMRGGTENLYGIVGTAKALDLANNKIAEHQKYIQDLKTYFIQELKNNFIDIRFNGNIKPEESLYTVLSVSFAPHSNAEMLLFSLDIAGIAASGGSACTSGSNQGSHVLKGIGAQDNRPSVRFSFSKYNTKQEIDFTINKLKEILA